MRIGVQYYRAPFPNERFWADDFARIKASGLDTVQLWVLWAWVESKPGVFDFGDYDRLIELAAKNGLGVVLSTIAEIQPYWIHREVPGSEMIDDHGHTVVSTNRGECHFGLTPGACTDHPGAWARMSAFLRATAERYGSVPHLRGWDAWNELRWNVNATGKVCYCAHTIAAYKAWLDERHGGLDGLNRDWTRRYSSWEDVEPGRFPQLPFTEMMAFQHFLTCRASGHARKRYDLIKAICPRLPVTVHGDSPTAFFSGWGRETAFNRGNDWAMADHLDGIGCSSFPKWQNIDDADFGMRIELVRSAAREKKVWLSEIQGGRASHGNAVHLPVDPDSQQRWVWNGVACGADMLLFWCWRDEVFGTESAGFGLCGDDGMAGPRLAAMKESGALLDRHRALISAYKPSRPEIGVWFSPQSGYLSWCQEGHGGFPTEALRGYSRALVRMSIPYRAIEEEHLDDIGDLKLLFMPRALVIDDATAAKLEAFVRGGGTLVVESECGAFDSAGLHRYPAERFIARLTGCVEVGRRALDATSTEVDGAYRLGLRQWTTPWRMKVDASTRVRATSGDGALLAEIGVGRGKVVLCGSYFGEAYHHERGEGFERFVAETARASGWKPDVEALRPVPTKDAFIYLKHGLSGSTRLVFVFYPEGVADAELRFRPGFFSGAVTDLISGTTITLTSAADGQRAVVAPKRWRIALLAGER